MAAPAAAPPTTDSCSSLSGFAQIECEIEQVIPIPFWAICVIVAVVLLAIIIIIVVCCCRRKKTTDTKESVSSKSPTAKTSAELVQPMDEDDFSGNKKRLGNIQISASYDHRRHQLRVTIHGANELPTKSGAILNTYCRCYLEQDRLRCCESKVVPASVCPRYDKDWTCKLSNRELTGALIVAVHETGRNVKPRVIGRTRIVFAENNRELLTKGLKEVWRPLAPVDPNEVDDTSAGDVCISFRYLPEQSKFNVVVYECKALRVGDGKQLLNPYIEMKLRYEKKPLTYEEEEEGKKRKFSELKKFSTEVKRKTNDPYFNESFEFEVPLDIMKRAELVLTVWSEGGMSPTKVGKLEFSRRSSGDTAAHWVEMLRGSKKPLAQWHTVMPPHAQT